MSAGPHPLPPSGAWHQPARGLLSALHCGFSTAVGERATQRPSDAPWGQAPTHPSLHLPTCFYEVLEIQDTISDISAQCPLE